MKKDTVSNSSSGAEPHREPHNPQTLPQQTQRNYLASLSAQWRELSDRARDSWRLRARDLRGHRNGHQLFVQVNLTLVRCGLPPAELPPNLTAFGILKWAGLQADDSPQLTLLQVNNPMHTADRLIIDATAPLSAGIENPQRGYRQLAIVPGPTPVPADLDLTAAYLARFGPPQPGRRIFLQLTEVTNGFKGMTFTCSALAEKS